jgi:23S rRNA G2445 N2-methylase RlmL
VIVDQLRIVGSPQTNKVMAGELSRLAVRALGRRPPEPKKAGTGQLIYPFDPGLAAVAATYARTPTRAVWDLYRSEAHRLEPLYDDLRADIEDDQRAWLPRGRASISVEVRRMADFAAGERQVVGTVKNAIVDGMRRHGVEVRVEPERPDVLVVARMDDDGTVVISVDLAGGSMSQRGWRASHGLAPLREHLAAVLLMLGRFDPRVDVLVDPMCGAGTIPIEAIMMARAEPRLRRRPPIPALDEAWPKEGPLFGDASPVVIGNDVDLGALVAAKKNAADAGVTGEVVWKRGHFASITPAEIRDIAAERGRSAERGLILCNPPYGERLDPIDLRLLYGELGDVCRQFPGWRAGFLVANLDFEQAFGLPVHVKKPLSNAGLRAYWYGYEL